jgi:ubiquinone biosynthesis protein
MPQSQRGQHLREMLDELGPTFVKFGQLLSTRPDVVPPDIVTELQKLQDDVRPVPYDDVERVIRDELELSVEQLFTEFETSAGRRRVHRAGAPSDAPERPAASRSRSSARTRRGRSSPTSRSSTRPPA